MNIFLVWNLATLIAATKIDIGPDDNILLDININRELSIAFKYGSYVSDLNNILWTRNLTSEEPDQDRRGL